MENTSLKTQLGTVGFAFPLSISMRYLRLTPTMRAKDVCDTFALARSLAILVDMLERIAGGLDTTVGQLFEGL